MKYSPGKPTISCAYASSTFRYPRTFFRVMAPSFQVAVSDTVAVDSVSGLLETVSADQKYDDFCACKCWYASVGSGTPKNGANCTTGPAGLSASVFGASAVDRSRSSEYTKKFSKSLPGRHNADRRPDLELI